MKAECKIVVFILGFELMHLSVAESELSTADH